MKIRAAEPNSTRRRRSQSKCNTETSELHWMRCAIFPLDMGMFVLMSWGHDLTASLKQDSFLEVSATASWWLISARSQVTRFSRHSSHPPRRGPFGMEILNGLAWGGVIISTTEGLGNACFVRGRSFCRCDFSGAPPWPHVRRYRRVLPMHGAHMHTHV